MAHLGFLRSVVLVSVLVGCGGKVGEQPASSTSDTGTSGDTNDDETSPTGFESWTATLTDVKVSWMYGGGSGGSPPSAGHSFRVDVDGHHGVVAMAPFARAIALVGFPGPMKASDGAGFFGVAANDASGHVSDNYDTLEITFGSDGRPVSAIARGRTERLSGDVGYEGTLEAQVSFARDAVKPAFRASASLSFASVPLPWDERVIEASEPYEETFGASGLFGAIASKTNASDISEDGWGTKKTRGARFTFRAWDGVAGLAIAPATVHDLAGNPSDRSELRFDGALDVPLHMGTSFQFGAEKFATWGVTKVVSEGCKSAKSCLQIGPFRWSYCASGSAGGAAIRLAGAGSANATVRGHAVRAMTYPGYPGSTPPNAFPQLAQANPSGDVKVADVSAMKWSSASSDGSFDTGWFSLSTSLGSDGVESGIAIGGGGVGPYSSGCSAWGGPPVPEEYDVTIFVDGVTLSK
ncbi:MAG: hypothetical protein ACXVEF_12425 [Polyangiales bacterium]